MLDEHLAHMFNAFFEEHKSLDALGQGPLICINKPGKPPTTTNTRPLTLLNTIRNIASKVLLARIYSKADSYITINQSAYRNDKRTSDLLWTYRYFMAITQKYQEYTMMGIDLSTAFDCVNRTKLTTIPQELPDEEHRRRRHRLARQRRTSQREAILEYMDGNKQPKRISITSFSPAN